MNNKDELDFNKNNRELTEKIMDDASTKKDDYWDKNNIFVRFILLILFLVIVAGSYFIIASYFS